MKLRERLPDVAEKPGVYLMKDRRGTVVYVGKAVNLRARLRSYVTRGGDGREFTRHLDQILGDLETIITNNEKEALLLENQLIKKHQPRFNIRLKDDKNFLKLRIDVEHAYPRVVPVRRIKKDGARYFGPYHSASALRNTLQTLNRHFQLRTCTDSEFQNRSRPCLQYQIKRCLGPCVLPVEQEHYQTQVDNTLLFLEGKPRELIERLKQEMAEASDSWNYEYAGIVRDRIAAIQRSFQSQQVVLPAGSNVDCLGFHREGTLVELQLLCYRNGQLSGSQSYGYRDQRFPSEEIISSFVGLYYEERQQIPDEVLLPLGLDDVELLTEWLSELRGRRVKLTQPKSGARARLVELANLNARNNLADERQSFQRIHGILNELQQRLGLTRRPLHIECFDNSNFQGKEPVSSKVAFIEGKPDRKRYRHFKLKSPETPNDFLMMQEVLRRRLKRGIIDDDLPDLIVIDGGKGQLSAAREILLEFELSARIDLCALAKARSASYRRRRAPRRPVASEPDQKNATPERVFLPGKREPVVFDGHSDALFLLQRLRDESHRFAIGYHRKLRKQRTLTSPLDGIPGIGKKRRLALLWHFGSLSRIKEAEVEHLVQCPGINRKIANVIHDHFRSDDTR